MAGSPDLGERSPQPPHKHPAQRALHGRGLPPRLCLLRRISLKLKTYPPIHPPPTPQKTKQTKTQPFASGEAQPGPRRAGGGHVSASPRPGESAVPTSAGRARPPRPPVPTGPGARGAGPGLERPGRGRLPLARAPLEARGAEEDASLSQGSSGQKRAPQRPPPT